MIVVTQKNTLQSLLLLNVFNYLKDTYNIFKSEVFN